MTSVLACKCTSVRSAHLSMLRIFRKLEAAGMDQMCLLCVRYLGFSPWQNQSPSEIDGAIARRAVCMQKKPRECVSKCHPIMVCFDAKESMTHETHAR